MKSRITMITAALALLCAASMTPAGATSGQDITIDPSSNAATSSRSDASTGLVRLAALAHTTRRSKKQHCKMTSPWQKSMTGGCPSDKGATDKGKTDKNKK